jgi:hypothetical protein
MLKPVDFCMNSKQFPCHILLSDKLNKFYFRKENVGTRKNVNIRVKNTLQNNA